MKILSDEHQTHKIHQYNIGLAQINNSFSDANYLPYSVGLLQAYAQQYLAENHKFNFLVPLYKRIAIDDAVEQLIHADIVGFSLYVWNEQFSLEVIRRLKKQNPNILVICGGPQVPDNASHFLVTNSAIDLVVHGEGELTFLEVLNIFPSHRWENIAGVSFVNATGDFITTPKRQRIKNLNDIPSPYISGTFDKLIESHPGNEWLLLWETNRGCPFKCTFCDWGSATAAKLFRFDLDRIHAELHWVAKQKIEFIFNCDANFGILPRDIEIAQLAAEYKHKYGYPKALSVQNTKNATERAYITQKILADAGLNKGVALSMQSVYAPALENIKRENISLKTYEELQNRFTKDNIATYSDLILGLPGETYDSFVNGISILIENGQHNRIQFNNLSVLPNAEMANLDYQHEFGIELVNSDIINIHGSLNAGDNEITEVQQLVVATKSMPPDMWRKTRAVSWMVAFLHFDKLAQIPLIIMRNVYGVSYRELIESFMDAGSAYPLLNKIKSHFIERAAILQNGGPEYYYSKQWLGIWWPDDEYMLIELATGNKLDVFYHEVQILLESVLLHKKTRFSTKILAQAIAVNKLLLKQPMQYEDVEIELDYNILEIYYTALRGISTPIINKSSKHIIKKSQQIWDKWEIWCKEVVWYGNKKGDYLYGSEALEKYYAGHY